MINLTIQISEILDYCCSRKALGEKTTSTYSVDLKQFSQFTKRTYEKNEICKYISHLHSTFKHRTVRRKIATLKVFTHYLMIEEIIDVNPFNKIETSFRVPLFLTKMIPLNTIRAILAAAYSSLSKDSAKYHYKTVVRDIAVLKMLFATYTRVSEIYLLKPDDINESTHTVKV